MPFSRGPWKQCWSWSWWTFRSSSESFRKKCSMPLHKLLCHLFGGNRIHGGVDYIATLLLCYIATLLHYYIATLLHCCFAICLVGIGSMEGRTAPNSFTGLRFANFPQAQLAIFIGPQYCKIFLRHSWPSLLDQNIANFPKAQLAIFIGPQYCQFF